MSSKCKGPEAGLAQYLISGGEASLGGDEVRNKVDKGKQLMWAIRKSRFVLIGRELHQGRAEGRAVP